MPTNRGNALSRGSKLQGGRYVVDGTLGEGAFGITYRATDMRLNRPVAIKELYPGGSQRRGNTITIPAGYTRERWSRSVASFLREAQTIANLEHPAIVTVHDQFEENGTAYMVMRFIDGVNLMQLAQQRGGRLPEADVLRYIAEVGDALGGLHQSGVLHRDVKPSNIIVNRSGRAVLVDFGAAREFVADQTMTHSVVLTPGFAPPEQLLPRARRGPTTDIYALAATCYFLLTGNLPDVGLDGRLDDNRLPPRIRAALEHALAYNPLDRPQTVAAFLAELQGRAAVPPLPIHLVSPTAPTMPTPRPVYPQETAAQREYQRNVAGDETVVQGSQQRGYVSPAYPLPIEERKYIVENHPPRSIVLPLLGAGVVVLVLLLVAVILLGGRNGSNPGGSVALALTSTPAPPVTPSDSPTIAQVVFTPTSIVIAKAIPTDTPLPTATPIPPSPTAAQTDTPVLPTNTAVLPTNTQVPLPTHTPRPPTNTPVPMPTNTPRPSPTKTPRPPTATPMPSPTDTPVPHPPLTGIPYLTSIFMVSADEGWAVGEEGAILHYTSGIWSKVASPTSASLYGIYMISSTEGWVVGDPAPGATNPAILHYSQGQWANLDAPILGTPIVNGIYTVGGLRSVYMTSAADGWAVGDTTILHYSNGSWAQVESPYAQHHDNSSDSSILNSVYMVSASEGWIMGVKCPSQGGSCSGGLILHYDGISWKEEDSQGSSELTSAYMVSPNEGWAVGGAGVILHYSNGSWKVNSHVFSTLESIHMVSATEGWAGCSIIVHYSKGRWTKVISLNNKQVGSMYFTSATEGWAVGDNFDTQGGLIMHYHNGSWIEY